MIRAAMICAALCATTAAHAKGDAQFWPQYQDCESIMTIAPLGLWIDDRKASR